MSKLTGIHYMYRDASNYKQGRTVWLTGLITDEQKEALKRSLNDSGYFIPEQIGLPHLGKDSEAVGWERFPTEDDHCWHELDVDEIESTEHHPARIELPTEGTVEEFVAKFTAIGPDGWDDATYGIEA